MNQRSRPDGSKKWEHLSLHYLSFESEEFLHQETKYCSDAGGDHFRWSRVEMAYLYEEFQANVVDKDAHSHHEQVAYKLWPTTHLRLFEADVSAQPKTAEKGYRKSKNERCNVCTNGNRSDVQHIVAEDEIVENEV